MWTAYSEDEQAVSIVKLWRSQHLHQVLWLEIGGDKPGTAEVEDIADSVTQDGRTMPSHTVWLGVLHVPQSHNGIVVGKVANIGTDILAGHTIQWDSSGLECLVNTLKQFSLLRVHGHGLGLRDPKERWVELVLVGDKVTPLEAQCSNLGFLRIKAVDVVPVRRRLRVSRSLVHKHLPEVVRGVRLARESTGLNSMLASVAPRVDHIQQLTHSHNGNWLGPIELGGGLIGRAGAP